MRINLFKTLVGLIGALLLASSGWGYSYITNSTAQPIVRPPGTTTLQILVDNSTVLSDHTTRAASIQMAAQAWNAQIVSVQFATQLNGPGSGTALNGSNEVFFSSAPYNTSWDSSTLAVTVTWYNDSTAVMSESDLLFNPNFTWDSYRGPRQGGVIDIRRVALHELGHMLGLDHPDQHGQTVPAIMNSTISDIDSLQADDIAGAQSLYLPPVSAPTIYYQPVGQSAFVGQSAQFFLTASGNPVPTLQWQRLPASGGAWANLINDSNYSGVTTRFLTVANTTLGMDQDQFRCVVSNSQGTVVSSEVKLTVTGAPSITQQPPAALTEYVSSTFVISVGVNLPNGAGTYKWQKNGVDVANSNSPVLIFNNAQFSDAGSYVLFVTNPSGSAQSNACVVTMITTPGVAMSSSGDGHTLIITGDGNLWGLGSNSFGALGLGSDSGPGTLPVQLTTGVAFASAGRFNSLYIKSDDTLWGCGFAGGGQLGHGPVAQGYLTPVQVGSNALQASTGYAFSLYVARDQGLWASGQNNRGQLGDGTTTARNTWEQIDNGVAWASAGYEHGIYVKTDGTLWSMGDNQYGQLGDGTTARRLTPVQIASGIRQAFAREYNSFFLKQDGTLWGMGMNLSGELGATVPLGTTTTSPVQLATGVTSAVAGSNQVFFIKTDATLWAMGNNASGGLGVGQSGTTLPYTATPLEVAASVYSVSASTGPFSFVKTDGSLWGVRPDSLATTGFIPLLIASNTLVAPPAPVAVSMTNPLVGGGVLVAWSAAPGAGAYQLWRNITNAPGGATLVADRIPVPEWLDTTATPGVNYYYWVKAANAAGTSAFSNAALAPGSGAPSFIALVLPRSVLVGSTLTFSVACTGTPLPALQWQRLPAGSGTWANLSNDVSYSGVTTPTLALSGVTLVMNGDQFRCVGTNAGGTATSNAALLTVNPPPEDVSYNAASYTVTSKPGALVSIYVSATNTGADAWVNEYLKLWQTPGNYLSAAGIGGIAPGETLNTVLFFFAPSAPGVYQYHFQASSNGVGTNFFGPQVTVTLITGTPSNDFNGDGNPDILLENSSSGQRVLWLMGGPNNAYVTQGLDLGSLDPVWHIVGTTDFNGDGKPDILLENISSGQRVLWLMGGPNNAYVIQGLDLGSLDPAWHIVGTADFNGDGKPDILLENVSSGQRVLWLMGGPNNAYVTQGLDLGSLDPSWHIVGTADFNGDGKPDILLENSSSGQRVLWLMGGPNNAYVIQGLDLGLLDPAWHIVALADFNHDGSPDILLENVASGQRVLWLMGGPNNAYVTQALDLGSLDPAWHIVK